MNPLPGYVSPRRGASGGVGVACTEFSPRSAHAAPRDACRRSVCGFRRGPSPPVLRPKDCSTSSWRCPEAAGPPGPPQANFFADPFGLNQQPERPQSAPASAPRVAGSGPAYCARSCDGKYFPLTMRGNATPAQLCQAFCPASATKVYYGSHIDSSASSTGERDADSENAFAYRKALRADCTRNGRDPAGLAPIDLALDAPLKAGDVIATTDGLVAHTGIRVGNEQSFDFTPVASYPGLTARRARGSAR